MLRSLSIRNYALIDSLDVEFPEGLIVISGETGAGKSILLGALSLLLGTRADALRNGGGANCVVEGEFENEDRQQYIIRRVITPAGRSRVFVNDEPVGMDELKAITAGLIDIHAQFDHSRLADSAFQLSILDGYAALTEKVAEFGRLHASRCRTASRLADIDRRIAEAQKNREYVEYQFSQLDGAHLRDGEMEELEAEQKQLAGSEIINENLSRINEIFSSEDASLGSRLRSLQSSLDTVARYIPEFAELSSRVASARVELGDIEYEVSSLGGRISFSPQRMQEVDDRMALLYDLMRRHSVGTVGELIALRDGFASDLAGVEDAGEERMRLENELKALDAECDARAAELSKARNDASRRLAEALQLSARSLEMPQAVFDIAISKGSRSASGDDAVEFLFSANGGVAPKPLAKCASGGELSRIMLCIKKIMSEYMGMPTLVFDEIDTGVSGSVADKMGKLIVEMGRKMQVFAITHLPQVASKGSAHFLVYKEMEDGTTHSRLRLLEGDDRVAEIARMLSGEKLTEEAFANAKVLLNNE